MVRVLTPTMEQQMSEQLTLFPVVSDSESVSLTEGVSDAKHKAIQRFLAQGKDSPIAHVNTYSPGRRNTEYYRLSYRVGASTKHIHIPGGSTTARLAQYRAKELLGMINRGAELEELVSAIVDWKK